jgi:hypothetical protein
MDPARQRLALGDSDDERPFKPASAVAANKIARFQGQGTVRKSKFELEREAEAERQRKEAEEAAAAYKDFVESFGGDDETGPSNPGARGGGRAVKTVGRGFVKAGGGEKYNPLADRPAPPAAPPSSTYQSPYGGPTSTHVSAPPAAGPSASAIPTGPRAMTRGGGAPSTRPLAASFMADDDEVSTAGVSSFRKLKFSLTLNLYISHLRRRNRAQLPVGRSAPATISSNNSRGSSRSFLLPPFLPPKSPHWSVRVSYGLADGLLTA